MHKYQIDREIGSGAFGSVFRAFIKDDCVKPNPLNENKVQDTWLKPGTPVAIKQMKVASPSWGEVLKLREISSLRVLIHPHIVKLYEVIREEKIVYLVFEYIGGGHLYQVLKQQSVGGDWSPQRVQSTMYQLFHALQHVHNHGYFHRDLKPENIMLDGMCCNPNLFSLSGTPLVSMLALRATLSSLYQLCLS